MQKPVKDMTAEEITDKVGKLRGQIIENTFVHTVKHRQFRLGFLFDLLRYGKVKLDDVPEPTRSTLEHYAELVQQGQLLDPDRAELFKMINDTRDHHA